MLASGSDTGLRTQTFCFLFLPVRDRPENYWHGVALPRLADAFRMRVRLNEE